VDGSVNINDEQLRGKPTSSPHLAISTGNMRLSGLQAEVVGWHPESYTSTSITPSLAPLSQRPRRWKSNFLLIEKS